MTSRKRSSMPAQKVDASPEEKVVIVKIVVAYDGSAYVGWQRQPNGISVQEKIEKVLFDLSGQKVILHGASRTDTGVHALGMVAHFEWNVQRPAWNELVRPLNALLPEDIRILNLAREKGDFHARFSAKWKLYRYRILNSSVSDPFRRQQCWSIHNPLNISAMNRAARFFVGKKDFSAVAVNPGYERTSMVRTIRRCVVLRKKDEVHVEVEGDGFFYKMVRTMVGTLVEVGLGKRSPEEVKKLILEKNRSNAGMTSPAHGLYLVKVFYT